MELIFQKNFRKQLFIISDYIALDSPNNSSIFYINIISLCQELKFMPNRFPKVKPSNKKNIRYFVYKGYKIIYQVTETKIIVLDIKKNRI